MKRLILIFLILITGPVLAGGDYVRGKLSQFSESNGQYLFHFIQTDERATFLPNCREFDVRVQYARVPSYSWLPFIHTSHPTPKQNLQAALYLQKAHAEKREVYFGYMGSGLIAAKSPCTFESRGLSLEDDNNKQIVLSFNKPV